MEIGISKNGALRVLSIKGNLHLQQWRVIERHLDALLDGGARRVDLDLSGVTFLEAAGIASLLGSARKFKGRGAELVLVAGDHFVRESVRDALRASDGLGELGECLFAHGNGLGAPES